MHITPETKKKIKRIELYTRRLLSGSLIGSSRTALKGVGFEFDQIRDYLVGDDLRFVDWHASARSQTLLVKQYIEERSRIVMLVIDVSRSMLFGVHGEGKYARVAWIASLLSLITMYGSDRVGCILYTDTIEHFIPPAKGHAHVYEIMRILFEYKPTKTKTNISVALKKLLELRQKKAVVFLISDFIDDSLKMYLGHVAKRHDIIAIRCLDMYECELPAIGYITVQDQEDGSCGVIDARTKGASIIKDILLQRMHEQNIIFKRCGIHCLDNRKDETFIGELLALFRRRMRY